jgi:Fe2+ transport system protein B
MHDEIQRLRDGAKKKIKNKKNKKLLSSWRRDTALQGAVAVVGILLYFIGLIIVFYFTLFFLLS